MGKTSVKSVNNYIARAYDRINFVMPKGRKDEIKEAAEAQGISASEWINTAIEAKLNSELENVPTGKRINLNDVPELSIYARNFPGGAISDKEWIMKAVDLMKDWQDHAVVKDMERESI